MITHQSTRPSLRWLTQDDLRRADRFFDRFGNMAVLVARLLPVVRTFIALPAGIARMPHWRFQLYTFVGSWPWCFVLASVGMVLGNKWRSDPRLHAAFHYPDCAIAVLFVIFVGCLIWVRWRAKQPGESR